MKCYICDGRLDVHLGKPHVCASCRHAWGLPMVIAPSVSAEEVMKALDEVRNKTPDFLPQITAHDSQCFCALCLDQLPR